ncbi:hypothetical protein HaLaN_01253, partial [Haematococcus lacustris]
MAVTMQTNHFGIRGSGQGHRGSLC